MQSKKNIKNILKMKCTRVNGMVALIYIILMDFTKGLNLVKTMKTFPSYNHSKQRMSRRNRFEPKR